MIELLPPAYAHMPFIREVYAEAFPKRERKPFWLIRHYMRSGRMELLSVCQDGAPVGLAVSAISDDTVLLDYFAIAASLRDQGLGGQAMAALLARYGDRQFFLEIESTELPCDNHEQCLSRKAFYLRNGLYDTGLRMRLFGVPMELLASTPDLDWPACTSIYRLLYGPAFSTHVVLEPAGFSESPEE